MVVCVDGWMDEWMYLRMFKPKHSGAFPQASPTSVSMGKRKKSRSSHGPGSASLQGMPEHMQYGGSRGLAQRYEYDEGSGAGFVELHPRHKPTGQEFFKMLQEVSGVTHVEWQSSKTSQNNISEEHYMERNILVQSELQPESVRHPMEFELTRNQHMKDKRLPITITACFKEPSPDLVPEAWRILAEVVKGRELFPVHVAQYRAKVLHRWENMKLNSQLTPEELALKKKHKTAAKAPPPDETVADFAELGRHPGPGLSALQLTRMTFNYCLPERV